MRPPVVDIGTVIRTVTALCCIERIHKELIRLHKSQGLDREDDKKIIEIWSIIEDMEPKYRNRLEGKE